MVTWVLDTSVVAKWFLQEEGTSEAEAYLTAMDQGAARIAVPSSLFYEMANVFWVRRRDGLTEDQSLALWKELLSLPLVVSEWTELLPQSISFAYRHQVSPYDAVFAVLARELGCQMITDDGFLLRKLVSTCPWVKSL